MNTWTTPKGTVLPILSLRGKDYLQVAHRLVWFREEHPLWTIETSYVTWSADAAFALATIKDETGRTIATAHKYEDERGFPDFREKAETGAIGRALALIGYGTQFCSDELEEGARLADSPLPRLDGKRIVSQQPQPEDGHKSANDVYRIPFGRKYYGKALKEIAPDELLSYVSFLEKSALAKNEKLTGDAADFVVRATSYMNTSNG